MSTQIPREQAYVELDTYAVGQPVATQGGALLLSNSLHALASVPREFFSQCFGAALAAAKQTFVVPFRRVYGCDTVRLTIVPHIDFANTTPTRIHIRAKVGTGAGSGPFIGANGGLEGTTDIYTQLTTMSAHQVRSCVLDVTGVAVGAVGVVQVVYMPATPGTGAGIAALMLSQVPRSASRLATAPATEPGTLPTWVLPGSGIYAGSAALATGWKRVAAEIADAEQHGGSWWALDYDENGTPLYYQAAGGSSSPIGTALMVWPARVMRAVPAAAPSTACLLSVKLWTRYTAPAGATLTWTVGSTTTYVQTLGAAAVPTVQTDATTIAVNAYDEWQQVQLELTAPGGGAATLHGMTIIDAEG